MTKIISGVFIQNLNDFKNKEPTLKRNQCLQFICEHCGVNTYRKNWRFKEKGYKFLCKHCLRVQTTMNRYGRKNAMQNEKVKEKLKRTYLEKYGVESVNQVADVKNKKKQLAIDYMKEKYGKDWLQIYRNSKDH